jgi:hypothetical protein
MDGILTNFAEALLLKHLCGVEAHTPKVQTFAALFTDDPTEAGNMVEPADAAYARVALNSAAWSTPAGRAIRNVGAVTFPEPTVQWAITHVGIVDAATAGNLYAYVQLPEHKVVPIGKAPSIAANALTLGVKAGGWSDYLAHVALALLFKNTAYAAPSLYLALSAQSWQADGTGGVEPSSANGYARQLLNAWTATTHGLIDNPNSVSFPACANVAWGSLPYAGVFDALTGGNLLIAGESGAGTINIGDVVRYPAGALDLTLD